jgi:hypothetical protein
MEITQNMLEFSGNLVVKIKEYSEGDESYGIMNQVDV